MASNNVVTINSVVLLGISEHHTRNMIQKPKGKQTRVIGGLMGRNIGGQITINSCFESVYELDQDGEVLKIDSEHLERKVKLIKTDDPYNHFRDDDFIGWYSTTPDARFQKQDLVVHNQISQTLNKILVGAEGGEGGEESSEGALYLSISLDQKLLNNPNLKEVPITIYRKNNQKNNFEQVQHMVNAEKGETISIESASQSTGGQKSQFAEKMQSTLNAVNRYNEKIEGLIAALDNPAVGKNLIMMRELKGILNSLPQQFQGNLDKSMLEQYSDANIMSFLSAISASNRVVQDVYQCNSNLKNSMSRRHQEMFM